MAPEKMAPMSTFHKFVSAGTALAAAILILGWTLPEPGDATRGSQDERQITFCTEIGCQSGLFFNLGRIRQAVPEAKRLEACVNGKCKSMRIESSGYQSFSLITGKLDSTAKVRLVLRDGDGQTIRRQRFGAPVSRLQPNGENCPPVCWFIQVKVRKSDGRLVALPQA